MSFLITDQNGFRVMRRGDELIERLAEGGNDETAHALLEEFFRAYPVEQLRLLLTSENDGAARTGAWIASELGRKARPLVEDMAQLLGHSSRYVRFFLLDGILAASTEQDGRAIAAALRLVGDTDDAVRWKAMNFLARATLGQIVAAQSHLDDHSAELAAWLIEAEQRPNSEGIMVRLESSDSLIRSYAVAAAVRSSGRDVSALQRAAQSSDSEVRSFALEHLSPADDGDS